MCDTSMNKASEEAPPAAEQVVCEPITEDKPCTDTEPEESLDEDEATKYYSASPDQKSMLSRSQRLRPSVLEDLKPMSPQEQNSLARPSKGEAGTDEEDDAESCGEAPKKGRGRGGGRGRGRGRGRQGKNHKDNKVPGAEPAEEPDRAAGPQAKRKATVSGAASKTKAQKLDHDTSKTEAKSTPKTRTKSKDREEDEASPITKKSKPKPTTRSKDREEDEASSPVTKTGAKSKPKATRKSKDREEDEASPVRKTSAKSKPKATRKRKDRGEDEAASPVTKTGAKSKPKATRRSKDREEDEASPATKSKSVPKSKAKTKASPRNSKHTAKDPSSTAGAKDDIDEVKALKSRKSIAYHKARKQASEEGKSADEAKAAGKRDTRLFY